MTGEQAVERAERAMAEAVALHDRALAPVRAVVDQVNESARLIGKHGPACLAQWFDTGREREHGD